VSKLSQIAAATILILSCHPLASASANSQPKQTELQIAAAGVGKKSDAKIASTSVTKMTATELREVRDLRAQEEMARWAFWMMIASVVGSLLTILGLAFVWRTLHHTRRTADFAGEAVADGKIFDASQSRAYVGPAAISYRCDRLENIFFVTIQLSNFGNTPAYKFRSSGNLSFVEMSDENLPSVESLSTSDLSHTLFPKQDKMLHLSDLIIDCKMECLKASSHQYVVTLTIDYLDHQGEQHSTAHWFRSAGSAAWDQTHEGSLTFHSDSKIDRKNE
jgi:hypothetical protein